MKKIYVGSLVVSLILTVSLSSVGLAQTRRPLKAAVSGGALTKAIKLARSGQYDQASAHLYQLSLSPKYVKQRLRIKYLLGLTLQQMGLHQVATFQFISVIQKGKSKYLEPSLQKLSISASALGDETLLNYAISRVNVASFPASQRDMLNYRIGEYQMRNAQYGNALRTLAKVPMGSLFYDKAKYLRGLAYASSGRPRQAAEEFSELAEKRESAGVTDTARVTALMGQARAEYQAEQWDKAISTYREIPRDSPMWHDTLFEASWAMLRSGKFRSALSNFHSLHSPYYEEAYLPESLLLRSIVYLYICQYDEMDKTLKLFNRVYRPVFKGLTRYLRGQKSPNAYFTDVVKVLLAAEKDGFKPAEASQKIPYVALQKVVKESDFKKSYEYIKKLLDERRLVKAQSLAWRNSGISKYASSIIEKRIRRARARAGRQVRQHLVSIRSELVDLFEQEGFIRFEMLNGKKEAIKKKVNAPQSKPRQVNERDERDYYIQNGYQYWTFRGEYWLDEIGNYHYVGTQSCQ